MMINTTWLFSFALMMAPNEEASELNLRALQKLKAHEEESAIEELEDSFMKADDEKRRRAIAKLLLELFAREDLRAQAYLLYLASEYPSSSQRAQWLLRLGDIHFSELQFEDAKRYYEKARDVGASKTAVDEKLAWLLWNQGQKAQAFKAFLDLYESVSEPAFQWVEVMFRLWLEMRLLPQPLWKEFQSSDVFKQHLDELFSRWARADQKDGEFHQHLSQAFSNEELKAQYLERAKRHQDFEGEPCLLFDRFLSPKEALPKARLLECARHRKPEELMELAEFFEALRPLEDEALAWAYAEALASNQQAKQALLVGFEALDENSSEFLKMLEALFLRLSQGEQRELTEEVSAYVFEAWMRQELSSAVLKDLQSIEPERWFSFEMDQREMPYPKDLLLRKSAWLKQTYGERDARLRYTRAMLYESSLREEEQSYLSALEERLERALPEKSQAPQEFGDEFLNFFQERVEDLDALFEKRRRLLKEWQVLTHDEFQKAVAGMLREFENVIDELKLPEALEDSRDQFDQQREQMKKKLRERYWKPLQKDKEMALASHKE